MWVLFFPTELHHYHFCLNSHRWQQNNTCFYGFCLFVSVCGFFVVFLEYYWGVGGKVFFNHIIHFSWFKSQNTDANTLIVTFNLFQKYFSIMRLCWNMLWVGKMILRDRKTHGTSENITIPQFACLFSPGNEQLCQY